jgi:hypothetical protein
LLWGVLQADGSQVKPIFGSRFGISRFFSQCEVICAPGVPNVSNYSKCLNSLIASCGRIIVGGHSLRSTAQDAMAHLQSFDANQINARPLSSALSGQLGDSVALLAKNVDGSPSSSSLHDGLSSQLGMMVAQLMANLDVDNSEQPAEEVAEGVPSSPTLLSPSALLHDELSSQLGSMITRLMAILDAEGSGTRQDDYSSPPSSLHTELSSQLGTRIARLMNDLGSNKQMAGATSEPPRAVQHEDLSNQLGARLASMGSLSNTMQSSTSSSSPSSPLHEDLAKQLGGMIAQLVINLQVDKGQSESSLFALQAPKSSVLHSNLSRQLEGMLERLEKTGGDVVDQVNPTDHLHHGLSSQLGAMIARLTVPEEKKGLPLDSMSPTSSSLPSSLHMELSGQLGSMIARLIDQLRVPDDLGNEGDHDLSRDESLKQSQEVSASDRVPAATGSVAQAAPQNREEAVAELVREMSAARQRASAFAQEAQVLAAAPANPGQQNGDTADGAGARTSAKLPSPTKQLRALLAPAFTKEQPLLQEKGQSKEQAVADLVQEMSTSRARMAAFAREVPSSEEVLHVPLTNEAVAEVDAEVSTEAAAEDSAEDSAEESAEGDDSAEAAAADSARVAAAVSTEVAAEAPLAAVETAAAIESAKTPAAPLLPRPEAEEASPHDRTQAVAKFIEDMSTARERAAAFARDAETPEEQQASLDHNDGLLPPVLPLEKIVSDEREKGIEGKAAAAFKEKDDDDEKSEQADFHSIVATGSAETENEDPNKKLQEGGEEQGEEILLKEEAEDADVKDERELLEQTDVVMNELQAVLPLAQQPPAGTGSEPRHGGGSASVKESEGTVDDQAAALLATGAIKLASDVDNTEAVEDVSAAELSVEQVDGTEPAESTVADGEAKGRAVIDYSVQASVDEPEAAEVEAGANTKAMEDGLLGGLMTSDTASAEESTHGSTVTPGREALIPQGDTLPPVKDMSESGEVREVNLDLPPSSALHESTPDLPVAIEAQTDAATAKTVGVRTDMEEMLTVPDVIPRDTDRSSTSSTSASLSGGGTDAVTDTRNEPATVATALSQLTVVESTLPEDSEHEIHPPGLYLPDKRDIDLEESEEHSAEFPERRNSAKEAETEGMQSEDHEEGLSSSSSSSSSLLSSALPSPSEPSLHEELSDQLGAMIARLKTHIGADAVAQVPPTPATLPPPASLPPHPRPVEVEDEAASDKDAGVILAPVPLAASSSVLSDGAEMFSSHDSVSPEDGTQVAAIASEEQKGLGAPGQMQANLAIEEAIATQAAAQLASVVVGNAEAEAAAAAAAHAKEEEMRAAAATAEETAAEAEAEAATAAAAHAKELYFEERRAAAAEEAAAEAEAEAAAAAHAKEEVMRAAAAEEAAAEAADAEALAAEAAVAMAEQNLEYEQHQARAQEELPHQNEGSVEDPGISGLHPVHELEGGGGGGGGGGGYVEPQPPDFGVPLGHGSSTHLGRGGGAEETGSSAGGEEVRGYLQDNQHHEDGGFNNEPLDPDRDHEAEEEMGSSDVPSQSQEEEEEEQPGDWVYEKEPPQPNTLGQQAGPAASDGLSSGSNEWNLKEPDHAYIEDPGNQGVEKGSMRDGLGEFGNAWAPVSLSGHGSASGGVGKGVVDGEDPSDPTDGASADTEGLIGSHGGHYAAGVGIEDPEAFDVRDGSTAAKNEPHAVNFENGADAGGQGALVPSIWPLSGSPPALAVGGIVAAVLALCACVRRLRGAKGGSGGVRGSQAGRGISRFASSSSSVGAEKKTDREVVADSSKDDGWDDWDAGFGPASSSHSSALAGLSDDDDDDLEAGYLGSTATTTNNGSGSSSGSSAVKTSIGALKTKAAVTGGGGIAGSGGSSALGQGLRSRSSSPAGVARGNGSRQQAASSTASNNNSNAAEEGGGGGDDDLFAVISKLSCVHFYHSRNFHQTSPSFLGSPFF